MVGAVVGAAAITLIAAIMPELPPIVVDTVVVAVMAKLMFTLLMVRRVIAAAARLRDSRHRDGSGRGQRDQTSCVSEMHGY